MSMMASPIVDDSDEEMVVTEQDIFNNDSIKTDSKLKRSEHKNVITQILWPRLLPSKESRDLTKHEAVLIALMEETLECFEVTSKILPTSTSKLFRSVHNINTSNDAQCISSEINQLKCGEMLGVFVRHQNCGLVIYTLPENDFEPRKVIVSTFPVSVPANEIYQQENSDFQIKFPTQSLKVEFSTMLNSLEFAKQLWHLSHNERKQANEEEIVAIEDDISTTYVSKWLVPILSNCRSNTATLEEFPIISKKIRDDVVGVKSPDSKPFRRSTYWTFIKVILQLNLTLELGHVNGKVMYKLVMLKFVGIICNYYSTELYSTLSIDTVSQLLAKMARRIEKMKAVSAESNLNECMVGFQNVYNSTIDEVKLIISKVRQKIDQQINALQTNEEINSKLDPLNELNFEFDVYQRIPTFREHLKMLQFQPSDDKDGKLIVKSYPRLYLDSTKSPNVKLFKKLKNPEETGIFLCDFENWILFAIELENDVHRFDSKALRAWSFVYSSKAEKYYNGDQLGFSRMVLTQLKILAFLDKIAVEKHELLKKHRPGINIQIFEELLLPQRGDVQVANKLKEYFRKRSKGELGPGLLEEEKLSNKSFSAIFAASDNDMKEVHQLIQNSIDKKKAEKKLEWKNRRKEMTQLKKQLESLECEDVKNSNGKRAHNDRCAYCKINEKVRNCRVAMFELPVPSKEYENNAVLFELRIPVEIACLRDVLCEVVRLFTEPNVKKINVYGNWIDCEELESFNVSTSERVFMATTKKPASRLNTRSGGIHADSNFDDCIMQNTRNCILYYSHASNYHIPIVTSNQSIKKFTTFTVELGSPYENLQWTLNGTSHTQNEVLARQCECPQSLTLSEYKNFGSLRADGHRLQLRNLYAAIETEALSFETQSVQSLIMQLLWEMGPGPRNESSDFTDPLFARAMIELIDKFIDTQNCNWKYPLKLLMTVLIAVRVFDMNDDDALANRIVQLLVKLRGIANVSISKVQYTMRGTENQEDIEKLRANLVEIATAGAMTFFVHIHHAHFDKILSGDSTITASRFWLEFLVTLNVNTLLSSGGTTKVPIILHQQMFQRVVHRIGIQLESKIKEMIKNDPNDLFEFIKTQWPPSNDGAFELKLDEAYPQTIIVSIITPNNIEHFIQIDIITGQFLLNNLPVSRLPKVVTEDPLFQKIFEQLILEVHQESTNSFCTKYKYKNSHYSFHVNRGTVSITEMKENGKEYKLIHQDIFEAEIPYLLVNNYSHWWMETEQIIEFRPIQFSNPNFSLPERVEYQLNLTNGTLMQMKTRKPMLDVTSESYQRIVSQLERLETAKYIHIFMNEPNVAKVELVRMNLKFIVDASDNKSAEYNVVSNEFHGMKIISEQKCGTLYGLRQGLILGSIPNETTLPQSKLLILPHARIDAQTERDHEIVKIDIGSELRNPTFYTYQIDELCHQVKASNSSYSAWFYLAYLHALTSHGQAEPLTEMSGTERALQILQSGFAWSSAPYDDEALAMLKLIANLAPHRKYKNGIQFARWPDFVHTHAAQDSFLFVTQKLLTDSQCLNELYPKSEKGKKRNVLGSFTKDFDIDVSKLEVNKREYFRSLPFYPNLKLSNCFLQHEISVASRYVHYASDRNILSTRMLSNLYHQNTFKPPTMFNLSDYLTIGGESLRIEEFDKEQEILDIFSMQHVPKLWISLYNVARTGELSRGTFALILSLLAHEHADVDFNAILTLQTVAANKNLFISIEPPDVEVYDLADRSFNTNAIEVILESCKTVHYSEMGNKDIAVMYDYIQKIVKIVSSQWPCDRILPSIFRHTHPNMNLHGAVKKINAKLRNWRNVQLLMDFLRKVDEQIQQLNSTATSKRDVDTVIPWSAVQLKFRNLEKFHLDFDAKIGAHLTLFENEVKEAERIYNKTNDSVIEYTAQEWWKILILITKPMEVQHLIDAGIYPRIVLTSMLPKLLSSTENPKLKAIVGAVAVKLVHEQRNRRISIYSQQPHMLDAYEREKENVPHQNWCPSQYPEWLLFEIEQNLTIRRIQIEIAMRMIDPPKIGTKHSIMQLNMGEGKTAVIVPILASILANEKHICQITVLKSLFATNLKALRQCLGGLLNRRIYTFPCRRDMPINQNIDKILNVYEECEQLKGIVLTLPEYQLSFQLKTYEAQIKNEVKCAKMLQAHKWLNEKVRNIFDESDAILHPKYQLIYTLGEQLSLDGGAQRWTIIQAVLNRLPHHLKKLWEDGDNQKIEFDYNHVNSGQVLGTGSMTLRSDVFTPCRILDYSIYKTLKTKLIDDFLCGRLNISISGIGPSEKKILKLLLNERSASHATFNQLIGKVATSHLTTILILSGLLRFDVLHNALNKRWRVNYGVNEKGPRQMAVPFKAKDVAAEMTEFGHPDIAICLTQLCYYYSGLTDAQLHQVFFTLGGQQNSADIYKGWIKAIPYQLVHKSIMSYNGVNLSDSKQRNELVFPLFRHNMYVIDYWLSNLVYPREARTFKYKLMSTPWDLCTDRLTHTVSGFSGTNDTKNILPMPISQNDLKELERTNDDVRNILLRDENNGYHKLPANVRGMEILIQMSKSKIPVLLDAGACMLELSNEEVAQKWLTLVPVESFDSALYFSQNNVLLTIDRNGFTTEFDCSMYCNNLDRCLVYLDDTHTRGTDLKFPLKWKACVTLSGDITRDKTVQACMRMRLLGKGHTIVFWASYEADIRIRELFNLGDATPTNKDVIDFICHNSQRFEEENMIHWLSAALNYTKKETAHKLNDDSISDDTRKMLFEKCEDDEYVTLEEMYGDREDVSLTQLSKSKLNKIVEDNGKNASIVEFVKSMENGVQQKLDNQASTLERFIHTMDEEQEKELEHEIQLEEERQVERPLPALSVTPAFDELLENIVKTGATSTNFATIKKKQGIISFAASLSKKQLFKAYEHNDHQVWAENLYVTRDFVRVIDDSTKIQTSDEYLRPPWWIARITNREGKDIIILLSSFETNHLLPIFRKSNRSALYMFRPRLSQCHTNLLDEAALQVTGMDRNDPIDLAEQVQLAVYAGSMYFSNDAEQNAYCGFLGLIPQPRGIELEKAFEDEIISSNGFVPPEYRCYSLAISRCVGQCTFQRNSVELAIMLIEAHHQFIRRESHVGSILEKSIKMNLNDLESNSRNSNT